MHIRLCISRLTCLSREYYVGCHYTHPPCADPGAGYNCSVQHGCCVVVGTFPWPWMSVGRLRDTVLVRCDLCVHGGGVLAGVCGASDTWCTGLQCCSLAAWVWLGWFAGGIDCAVVCVVLGDAAPLLRSPCNTPVVICRRTQQPGPEAIATVSQSQKQLGSQLRV